MLKPTKGIEIVIKIWKQKRIYKKVRAHSRVSIVKKSHYNVDPIRQDQPCFSIEMMKTFNFPLKYRKEGNAYYNDLTKQRLKVAVYKKLK